MRTARALGWLLQAVVLGVLLFIALVNLLGVSTGSTVFRYQGF